MGQKMACPHCTAALLIPQSSGEQAAPEIRSVEAAVTQPQIEQRVSTYSEPKPLESLPDPEFAQAPRSEQNIVAAPVTAAGARVAAEAQRRAGTSAGNRRAVRTPKKSSKLPLLVATALIVLSVAGFAGVHISRDMARAKLQKDVDQEALQAQTALDSGEIDEAAKRASNARSILKASPYEADLDADKKKEWKACFEKVDGLQKSIAEIDLLLKEAARAPASARVQLEKKKALFDDGKGENKPIVSKIVVALDTVEKLELAQQLAGLRKDLDAAEKLYAGGQVEEAVKAADAANTKLAGNDKLQDKELRARIAKMRRNGERHNEIRGVRTGAAEDFEKAAKRLDDLAKSLDAAKPDDKPLVTYLESAQRELKEEAAKAKRVTPEDLESLKQLAGLLSQGDTGIEVGEATPAKGVRVSYNDNPFWLVVQRQGDKRILVVETGGQSFEILERMLVERNSVILRAVQHVAAGMKEAQLKPGAPWTLVLAAPVPFARRNAGDKINFFYAGQLYQGTPTAQDPEPLRKAVGDAARELEKALLANTTLDPEIQTIAAKVAEGAHKQLDKNDHLPLGFCRQVLFDRYLEKNLPAAAQLKPQLDSYHKAYAALIEHRCIYSGTSDGGDEFEALMSASGSALFRTYDKVRDVTVFGMEHPSEERPLLFVLQEYKGRHAAFPAAQMPLVVKMTHPALGVVASCDMTSGKLAYEDQRWTQVAALTTPRQLPPFYGEPQWAFPPHVVMVDQWAHAKAVITPAGRVDFPHFSQFADVKPRREAQEQFIDQVAKAFNSTGYLNLYYIYFHQYTLDSPATSAKHLLGSKSRCGDIHQTIYESLDRELANRHLGDCDDLAELFQVITERQGKLSFVMALPGHAACGWVDKLDNGHYLMQFLQTGPPLQVEGADLDKVIEVGSRLHDTDRTMRFDPKSMGFLFRFAGEPTRTPYWLSTRMFVDKQYAETMERVQGYWHFHFYALGIQTMEDMIGKGDRVPENCTELAGLYGQVRETKKAVNWIGAALKQLGPDDILTRSNELLRMAQYYKRDGDDAAAYETLKPVQAELKRLLQLRNPREYQRFINSRMELSALLTSIKQPWEAYELIERDAELFKQQPPRAPFSHGGVLTVIYEKMLEQVAEGKTLSIVEQAMQSRCEKTLEWYFSRKIFQPDDDFNDVMRKYAMLGRHYASKLGKQKYLEEILKDGPWPAGERNHTDRRTPNLEEDWKWIRMSLASHLALIGDALDIEEPREKWRPDEAIKVAEAMNRAAIHARKLGSLSMLEFSLYTTRVLHAFLTKNWEEFEEVMKVVKEKNWARLTSEVSDTFGECARFVTPQEFHQQYKVFCRYVDTKVPYFTTVYEAYRVEGFEHARLSAQEALKRWPEDEDMKREAKYLEELIKNRIEEQKKKPVAPKPEAPKKGTYMPLREALRHVA